MSRLAEALEQIDDPRRRSSAMKSGPHVGRRLTEAMRTLSCLPMGEAVPSRSLWPPYSYEWSDLLAQNEQGELERTQHQQNTIRLLPSCARDDPDGNGDLWPAQFLSAHPSLLQAVNAVARNCPCALILATRSWVAKGDGGYADTWRERYDQGCDVIARGLSADRVPVFLMALQLPRGAAREYLALYGITAVYVAEARSGSNAGRFEQGICCAA